MHKDGTSHHIFAAAFQRGRVCSIRRWSDKGALKFYRAGSSGDRRYWHDGVLRFLEDSRPHLGADTTIIGWEGQLLLEELTPSGDVHTSSRSQA